MTSTDLVRLTELARLEAERHPVRSPRRRAASHLWAACVLPGGRTVASVRNAVLSFGTEATQQAALELLHRLATERTHP